MSQKEKHRLTYDTDTADLIHTSAGGTQLFRTPAPGKRYFTVGTHFKGYDRTTPHEVILPINNGKAIDWMEDNATEAQVEAEFPKGPA